MTLFVYGMLYSDPLVLSDAIAEVLHKSFRHKLISEHFVALSNIPIPLGWSKELAVDCEHLSYVLAITPDMNQYLVATYNYYMPLVYDYYAKGYVDNIYYIHKRKVAYVSTHWLADRNKYVLTINIKYTKSSYKCNFNGYVTLKYWSLPVVYCIFEPQHDCFFSSSDKSDGRCQLDCHGRLMTMPGSSLPGQTDSTLSQRSG